MGIMRSRDVCTSLGGRGADSRRGFNTAGKNMQLKTRYDGKLPVALSDWRFVCEHRSDGLRCNYNLSILLAFFLVKNINRLRHLFLNESSNAGATGNFAALQTPIVPKLPRFTLLRPRHL
jgi:hypothetical protein